MSDFAFGAIFTLLAVTLMVLLTGLITGYGACLVHYWRDSKLSPPRYTTEHHTRRVAGAGEVSKGWAPLGGADGQ